jgi:hypothetical protein
MKRQYKKDSDRLVKTATVVQSNLCQNLSEYELSLALRKRLDQIADDLRTLAGFYDYHLSAPKHLRRPGNNIDSLRNDIYFESL